MLMIRILIVLLIVVVGAAALTTLNPLSDKSTNPIIKGLNSIQAWFKQPPTIPQTINPTETSQQPRDDNETKVYKWQDQAGEWHFSNEPPPAGISSSVKIYRSDVNITPAPSAVVTTPEEPPQAAAIPDTASPLLPITDPERVKQLIEDAKNVQNLVDSRKKTIDQQVDGK